MVSFPEYESYDAIGLAGLVAKRAISPKELLAAAVERIEAQNPYLNAIVHRLYDRAEQAIAAEGPKGPFWGVPFLLKDLTHYRGAATSFGSRLFDGFVADYNSTVTERFLRAGLIVVGKTNTPEFGLTGTTEPVLHGPTRNPWDPARSPGGSSGGSGAAVAAGVVPAAHASDGGGSIRNPASCCGLFGLKLRIPMKSAGDSGLKSATHSD